MYIGGGTFPVLEAARGRLGNAAATFFLTTTSQQQPHDLVSFSTSIIMISNAATLHLK